MDVFTAIRSRRDIERFAEQIPPRDLVERLIDAAIWAPNHRLTEPWRFVVLAGAGREAMGDAIAASLAVEGKPEGAQRSARSKLLRAPVTVVVAQVATPEDATRDLEDYAACVMAVQNILLAAHAEGMIAHFSTGAMVEYEGAKSYIGLAPHDRIVGYVNLGYPRPEDPPKEGQRSAPVVRWDWT